MLNCKAVQRDALDNSVAKSNEPPLLLGSGANCSDNEDYVALVLEVGLEGVDLVTTLGGENLELVRLLSATGKEDFLVVFVEFTEVDLVLVLVVARNQLYHYLLHKVHVMNRASFGSNKSLVVLLVHRNGNHSRLNVLDFNHIGIVRLNLGADDRVMSYGSH